MRRSLSTKVPSWCPATPADGWMVKGFSQSGFYPGDKPISQFTEKQRHLFLYGEVTKVKISGINMTYEGLIPEDHQVDAVERPRCAAAARPRLRRACRHLRGLPGVRRHPPDRRCALLEDRGREHRPTPAVCRLRIWPTGCADSIFPKRARFCRRSAPPRRLVTLGLGYLSLERPSARCPGRGAAHQDAPASGLFAHRHHLRLRRADDRPAPARHPAQ